MRRTRGTGSVYFAGGVWRFAYRVDGIRKVRTSTDEAKVRQWAAEHAAQHRPAPTRQEQMRDAQRIGTRTRSETFARRRQLPNECAYCHTALNEFNEEWDHIVPIGSGGSDSVDNLQVVCWECNREKGKDPGYTYEGEPRAFKVAPNRRRMYDSMRAARARL